MMALAYYMSIIQITWRQLSKTGLASLQLNEYDTKQSCMGRIHVADHIVKH